ncbi:hypothetical protein PM082_017470 [Marasmius tenuissimus]|nr:hypothetical protein PM082_017470 [Marasmius tenuissimus]
MSSPTSATPSSSAASQTSSPSGGSNSSNLYLFTFVATLFVLLMISSTIIFRSYILRRRYQRRLQEALAAGVILAPREQGSRRKRFRTRPKFYDVWFDTAGDTWEELMPVSVQPVKTKRRRKHTTTPVKVEPEPQPKISERVLGALSMGRHRAFRSSPGSGSTSPTAPDQEAAQTAPSPAGIEPPTTADVTSPVSPDPEKSVRHRLFSTCNCRSPYSFRCPPPTAARSKDPVSSTATTTPTLSLSIAKKTCHYRNWFSASLGLPVSPKPHQRRRPKSRKIRTAMHDILIHTFCCDDTIPFQASNVVFQLSPFNRHLARINFFPGLFVDESR